MKNVLSRSFYNQPTIDVSRSLLGKFVFRKIGKKMFIGKIVETEAYLGKNDLACHSSRGITQRNKVMFGRPGVAYVYFIYGMHYCFNIVTEKENEACAVLIRALEPLYLNNRKTIFKKINTENFCNIKAKCRKDDYFNLLNGPAKLCREFEIDKRLNGWDITIGKKLWIGNGEIIKQSQIKKSKRVGVDYAGNWKDKLLRFYIKDSKFISRK